MVGHGGNTSYLADPTSPIPSHSASIVVTSTLRVNLLLAKKPSLIHFEKTNMMKFQEFLTTAYDHSSICILSRTLYLCFMYISQSCYILFISESENAGWRTLYCFSKMAYVCQIAIHTVPNEITAPPGKFLYNNHICLSNAKTHCSQYNNCAIVKCTK